VCCQEEAELYPISCEDSSTTGEDGSLSYRSLVDAPGINIPPRLVPEAHLVAFQDWPEEPCPDFETPRPEAPTQEEFQVIISRWQPFEALGIDLEVRFCSDDGINFSHFEIVKVYPNFLMYRWNCSPDASATGRLVYVGDAITSVNGMKGKCPQMIDACRGASTMDFLIKRSRYPSSEIEHRLGDNGSHKTSIEDLNCDDHKEPEGGTAAADPRQHSCGAVANAISLAAASAAAAEAASALAAVPAVTIMAPGAELMPDQVERNEFLVPLMRLEPLETVGIDVRHYFKDEDQTCFSHFEVTSIYKGFMLSRWNQSVEAAESARIVTNGDWILMVNGIRGDSKTMIEQFKSANVVSLLIRRVMPIQV